MHSDKMQKRNSNLNELTETLNDQDFKQKMGMYSSFGMEFYRVLMGSFLIIFVPQKCNDHICSMTDNISTGDIMKDVTFSFNIITFASFLLMYYAELKRENKMITYLDVNPELPRDNDSVGEALVKLPLEKKNDILKLDKLYQRTGRCAMVTYFINVTLSTIVALFNYLDDKTVTVLLTNAIFMALKLYDTKTITDTEDNIFLSAYLTRRIQYNDTDPDKVVENIDIVDTVNVETFVGEETSVSQDDPGQVYKEESRDTNGEILNDNILEVSVFKDIESNESNTSMDVFKDIESNESNTSMDVNKDIIQEVVNTTIDNINV